MSEEDLKCCGNCSHYDDSYCRMLGGIRYPNPSQCCDYWDWDNEAEIDRKEELI